MDPKTSTKANVFLSVSLICHLLATATACDTCNTSLSLSPTPPSGGGSGGSDQGQQKSTCPRDALKLGVCAKLLGGAVDVEVGKPPTTPCCTLLAGLVDLEAAICICTAIRANVLGININIPITLSPLLSKCGITLATDLVCA